MQTPTQVLNIGADVAKDEIVVAGSEGKLYNVRCFWHTKIRYKVITIAASGCISAIAAVQSCLQERRLYVPKRSQVWLDVHILVTAHSRIACRT